MKAPVTNISQTGNTKNKSLHHETQSRHSPGSRTEQIIILVLCAAVFAAGILQFVGNRPADAETFAPFWLPFVAAGLAVAGIILLNSRLRWLRLQSTLIWIGLMLMLWVANGLPLDLLRIAGIIPLNVDWLGLATRTLSLVAAVMLARLALAYSFTSASGRTATWYGYAAFAMALPYPVMRTVWALGGTLGLMWSGAAGHGFAPWLACIPWLLAAALSLLLVSTPHWMPRRLLLIAGWSATAIVAMVGPSACWSLVTGFISGDLGLDGIANWVPCLFYGSWLLWAIAAGAATRAYQLRSAKDSNLQDSKVK